MPALRPDGQGTPSVVYVARPMTYVVRPMTLRGPALYVAWAAPLCGPPNGLRDTGNGATYGQRGAAYCHRSSTALRGVLGSLTQWRGYRYRAGESWTREETMKIVDFTIRAPCGSNLPPRCV